jgi:hypothetical protein
MWTLRIAAALSISLLCPTGLGALDRGADGGFDQRRSAHFRLLQDVDIDQVTGPRGSQAFERSVLKELERAYDELRRTLDLRPRQDVKVVIYDPAVFEQAFAKRFRFNAVGFYEAGTGVIYVRGNTRVDAALVRTLHHEYCHAALDAAGARGRVPAWLNEGLSQWFENLSIGKRGLSRGEFSHLAEAHRHDTWLPLETISRTTLANLAAEEAGLAYLQSYAMVDYLVREHGDRRMRSFIRQLVRSGNLGALMRREFRVDLNELESAVRAQFP